VKQKSVTNEQLMHWHKQIIDEELEYRRVELKTSGHDRDVYAAGMRMGMTQIVATLRLQGFLLPES